jgi:MFS family permease
VASPSVGASRRIFAGVSFAALAGFVSLGAIVPALPRLVTGPLGGGEVEVGIAVGAFGVGGIFARPVVGRLIDTVGRRPVMLAGLLGAASAGVLYTFADGMVVLVAIRLLHGVAAAAVYTAGAAWVVDIAPVARRGQVIGLYGLGVWTGQALGPLAGEAAYRLGGYSAVWTVAAVAPLVGAVTVLGFHAARPAPPGDGARVLLPVAARLPALALVLSSVGVTAVTGFALLLADSRDIDGGALVWPAFGVGIVLARIVLGRLPDTIGARRCAIWSCLGQAAGTVVIALAPNLATALVGAIVAGGATALVFPALALLVVDRTPFEQRGAALGAFTAGFDLGFAAGGLVLGVTAELFGYGEAFVLAAAACVLAAVVAARAARPPSPS